MGIDRRPDDPVGMRLGVRPLCDGDGIDVRRAQLGGHGIDICPVQIRDRQAAARFAERKGPRPPERARGPDDERRFSGQVESR